MCVCVTWRNGLASEKKVCWKNPRYLIEFARSASVTPLHSKWTPLPYVRCLQKYCFRNSKRKFSSVQVVWHVSLFIVDHYKFHCWSLFISKFFIIIVIGYRNSTLPVDFNFFRSECLLKHNVLMALSDCNFLTFKSKFLKSKFLKSKVWTQNWRQT